MISALTELLASFGLPEGVARIAALGLLGGGGFMLVRTLWNVGAELLRAGVAGPKARARAARRTARRAARTGDYTFAAESLELAGLWSDAHEMREQAAEHARAQGELALAARHLAALGRPREAGQLMLQSGSWREALGFFQQANLPIEEARALERGRQLEAAATRYEVAGRPRDALRCLERAMGPKATPDQAARRQQLAMKAAEIARRIDLPLRAAEILEQAGLLPAAAGCWHEAGRPERAAELLQRSGRLEPAALAWEAAGEPAAAARCRAEARMADGDAAGAIALYREAGDEAGVARAAELAGRPAEAALIHERAGAHDEAARLWMLAGEPAKAAACYQRAEAWLHAGRAYDEASQPERALACLRCVPEDDPARPDALAAAARIMLSRVDVGEARDLLQAAIDAAPKRGREIDVATWLSALGRCHEKLDDLDAAKRCAERALSLAPDHSSARKLLARVTGDERDEAAVPERYSVVRPLAAGGMGCVWLARDVRLDRLVALKVLSDKWCDRPELRERFLREATLAARVQDPSVVTVYDVGEHRQRPFMALEYVPGRDLRLLLEQEGRLTPAQAAPILRGIARALAAAHATGVVHRDVKPANVFLGEDGTVKVGDFGIARLEDADNTIGGLVFATPQYVAPEQVTNDPVDGRTDIYSFGATAFTMLCGRTPFVGADVAKQHVHAAPPDPRELEPRIPGPLAELVLRCLAKSPDDRPASARELLRLLDEVFARPLELATA